LKQVGISVGWVVQVFFMDASTKRDWWKIIGELRVNLTVEPKMWRVL